jgi:hypothetical protein
MIIRVFQATIAPRRSAEFHAFAVEQGLPGIRANDGLIDVYMGLRSEGTEDIGVIVSIWRDWDAIAAAIGPDPSRPYLLTLETGLITSVDIVHFEAIDPIPTDVARAAAVVGGRASA